MICTFFFSLSPIHSSCVTAEIAFLAYVKNAPQQDQFKIIALCFELCCILERNLFYCISFDHLFSHSIYIYRISTSQLFLRRIFFTSHLLFFLHCIAFFLSRTA